jgi:Rrf2 family nitric oxide-sensitive transcriptional repressor
MRLTMRTNLAMRTLMFCAVNPGRTVRKAEIASYCNASENHLGLVIHKLSQAGFLHTVRGRNGGVMLNDAAEKISVGRVARVFEASVPFAECFSENENQCPIKDCCRLRTALSGALEAFYAELDKLTLDDLTRGNSGLTKLLEIEPAA